MANYNKNKKPKKLSKAKLYENELTRFTYNYAKMSKGLDNKDSKVYDVFEKAKKGFIPKKKKPLI